MALAIGTEAPDFTLVDSDGTEFTLSSVRGTPVYLNFYPVAFSPVCTDWFTAIAGDDSPFADAIVIGVSVDSKWSLAAFKRQMNADNVTFLADFNPKGAVAQLYDVWLDKAGIAGRATYVIDANGIIVDVDQVAPLEMPDADRLIAALGACRA
ncbi:MAG: redoxin domain-containing protein [Thermoleophilia bacterium]|nr:redoxin domain-containing protein [Thermoleophilia bacterium]